MSNHCSGNNGFTQVEEKHCVFQKGKLSQEIAPEYSCAPQQTVKTALLVKPNPMLLLEKRVLSLEGRLDPSLLRWLPPVVLQCSTAPLPGNDTRMMLKKLSLKKKEQKKNKTKNG